MGGQEVVSCDKLGQLTDPTMWMSVMRKTLFAIAVLAASSALAQDSPSFNRDVRPVLARNCFPCHGPDEEERQADLRLDVRQAAVEARAIDAKALSTSKLLLRVFSTDPDEQMPPADSGHTLTSAQKQLLKKWVLAGAKYEKHWSFVCLLYTSDAADE